jgi:SWIM zinc finger
MNDTLVYQYADPSALVKKGEEDYLFLSKFSEIEKADADCFFWGHIKEPFLLARCLITLSNIVKSSFSLTPADFARMKDPIVTAGSDRIRFEGFSFCAGVYGRVDVSGEGFDGEFPANGTTNVDFNQPMISALSRIQRNEAFLLSVGKKEVSVHYNGERVVERKVPLPVKWIKGLTTVQVYLAGSENYQVFSKVQAIQLFQTLPTGKPKTDYYLVVRAGKAIFSPVRVSGALVVGGIQRLKLLEPLLPLCDKLVVFAPASMQSTTWQLYLGPVRFTFSLSREAIRGFSGEGAALNDLLDEVPDALLDAMDKYSFANQVFNPTMLAVEEGIEFNKVDNLAARLSAMGLLGFDLDENHFFYRRLPFKLSRILSLNPRLKNAEKLVAENKVSIITQKGAKTEARVAGTGVDHIVILNGEQERCTCTWFARHEADRGPCKHILAVKKITQSR